MDDVTRAIMHLSARIEDVSRRQASMILSGPVAEIDGNRVRLELGPADETTGKPFLSPWVQLQDAAGATGTHFPVKVGDPMRLLSPNGEIGSASLAVRDSHTTDAPNPAEQNSDFVIAYGGGSIVMRDGEVILSGGGASVRLAGGDIALLSGRLVHNEKNVGDTHNHGGVKRGGSNTDEPNP